MQEHTNANKNQMYFTPNATSWPPQVCYSGKKQCNKSWGELQNSSFGQQHITQDTTLPFHEPKKRK